MSIGWLLLSFVWVFMGGFFACLSVINRMAQIYDWRPEALACGASCSIAFLTLACANV